MSWKKAKRVRAPPTPTGIFKEKACYEESDITTSCGVSINLVPVDGFLRVKPPINYHGDPVIFQRKEQDWVCQHIYVRILRGIEKEPGKKCCKVIKHNPSKTNIKALRDHCISVFTHWKHRPAVNVAKGQLLFGAKPKKKKANNEEGKEEEKEEEGKDDGEKEHDGEENEGKSSSLSEGRKSPTTHTDQCKNASNLAVSFLVDNVEGRVSTAQSSMGKSTADSMIDTEALKESVPLADDEEIVLPSRTFACMGIMHKDFPNITFPPGFDFTTEYEMSTHSGRIDPAKAFRGYVLPSWNVGVHELSDTRESVGIITSKQCHGSMVLDYSKEPHRTASSRTVCKSCHELLFHQPLLKALSRSASRNYGQIQDRFCPLSEIIRRKNNIAKQYE